MAKHQDGTDHQLPAILFALNERRTQVYIPYLEKKIEELEARLETQGARSTPDQGNKE